MPWRETLSEDELKGVDELKRLLSNECTPYMLEDDTLFYRFMKARDFNLKNAEAMLRKSIAWRKEKRMDTFITEFKIPEVLQKHGPISLVGYDKDGDIVKYADFGRADPKGLLSSVKKNDLVNFFLYHVELEIAMMRENGKKTGKTEHKVILIGNFDDLTFSKATYKKGLEVLTASAKIHQDNYPEVLKRSFFINCSFYFTLLFSVLKPFLAPALQEKILVFGSEGYADSLLEMIDADVLPAFLGGRRTDPGGDPECRSSIIWSTTIPEKYYFRKSERRLSSIPGVKKLTVTRFSKSDVRIEVSEPDSFLEWEFETMSRDIGFGLFFKASPDSTKEELVPKQRIDTDVEPETGVYKCIRPGTYIIVFDNSYSWIYQKEIFYRVRVIASHEGEKLSCS